MPRRGTAQGRHGTIVKCRRTEGLKLPGGGEGGVRSITAERPGSDAAREEKLSVGDRPYEPFFLRSAQRFFIANDNRLLPSGVSPPRFLAFNADGRDVAILVFLAVRGEFAPSSVLRLD